MLQVLRVTYYAVLFVFVASAAVTLCAIIKLWFLDQQADKLLNYPFLGLFIGSVILEAVAVVFLFVKVGLRYLPRVEVHKTHEETVQFMCKYIRAGTSVTIVSNRLSLAQSEDFFNEVISEARQGKQFEMITSQALDLDLQKRLGQGGVKLYVTGESGPPEARFTLINSNRAGAERLAIAKGTHPEHEVTIFDNASGPHMIAMAKDIVRKSKILSIS